MNGRDTEVFNSKAHEKTVKEMHLRSEKVHDKGQQIFRETGRLDPMVDIKGKTRESRNAMAPNPDGTCILPLGIKMPVISLGDGTGSMGDNVGKVFKAMGELFEMLSPLQQKYQIDLSVAIVQDVCDPHPVFQMAQFESDNRAADHVTKLIPDKQGGDTPEDYDLALWYINEKVDTDIVRYGLKGYLFIIADAPGRNSVKNFEIDEYLGHQIQDGNINTKKICRQLLEKWNIFFIQIGENRSVSYWWADLFNDSRVIVGCNPDYLAEIQAGLMFVTETPNPTKKDFIDFLQASGNNKISTYEAEKIWHNIQSASQLFGAQSRLNSFSEIPQPGDIFRHYRDIWPIGHPREGENSIRTKTEEPSSNQDINWSKF